MKAGDSHEQDTSWHNSRALYKSHHDDLDRDMYVLVAPELCGKWAHSRVFNALTQQDRSLVTALPGNVHRSVLNLKTLISVHGIHTVDVSFFRVLGFP